MEAPPLAVAPPHVEARPAVAVLLHLAPAQAPALRRCVKWHNVGKKLKKKIKEWFSLFPAFMKM